eukprot:5895633-Lingulodinium_polyedra.AAC.1
MRSTTGTSSSQSASRVGSSGADRRDGKPDALASCLRTLQQLAGSDPKAKAALDKVAPDFPELAPAPKRHTVALEEAVRDLKRHEKAFEKHTEAVIHHRECLEREQERAAAAAAAQAEAAQRIKALQAAANKEADPAAPLQVEQLCSSLLRNIPAAEGLDPAVRDQVTKATTAVEQLVQKLQSTIKEVEVLVASAAPKIAESQQQGQQRPAQEDSNPAAKRLKPATADAEGQQAAAAHEKD